MDLGMWPVFVARTTDFEGLLLSEKAWRQAEAGKTFMMRRTVFFFFSEGMGQSQENSEGREGS